MAWMLNVIYLSLIVLGSPYFLFAAIKRGKYRDGYREKFLGLLPRRRSQQRCAWFHAVSVGEVVQLGTLLKEFRQRFPDWDIVVTTTTQTGLKVARDKYPELTTCYCPLDFSWAVNRAMKRIQPNLLVLVELEIWPNLICAASRRQVPVAVVNGRITGKSFRGYQRAATFFKWLLSKLDFVVAQNETYADRFQHLGVATDKLAVVGSIKFDGAETNRDNPFTQQLRQLAGLQPEDRVWLAGSTIDPEEEVALRVYSRIATPDNRLKLILAPRHPDRCRDLQAALNATGKDWRYRSELLEPLANAPDILVVDTVGELKAWWGTADIAYVGGSWREGRGGQNMIEPAAYGAAVSFGPHTENFRDVVRGLLDEHAAVVVRREDQLEAFVRKCVDDPTFGPPLGEAAQQIVLNSAGATTSTVDKLAGLLESPSPVRKQAA